MRDLISGLFRPALKLTGPMRKLCAGSVRLRHDADEDRGAVGVLVAILIGGGVLLGLGAMVVDVGQIYAERAQLQSGADAGALGVAKSCVLGTCSSSTAQSYASANSAHGSAADTVCGSGSLGACSSSTGAITDCPQAPSAGTSYVEVHTSTRMPNGSTLLPPVFAKTLIGNQSYNGTTVRACAQAEWGPPASASGVGITFSACSWDEATSDGTVFAPPPPYPPNALPSPSLDQVLELHSTAKGNKSCPTEPAGADSPGEFGWTLDPNGNCTTPIISGSYDGNTGNGVSNDCKLALASDQANKTLIFIPIYVSVTGPGNNSTFTLKGFAAFVITGYHLTGSFSQSDWLNPANDCTGSTFCVNGYFTQGLIPATGPIGSGPDLGADIIELTG